ncbi:MAG: DUF1501 domain-containing protein [Acidobacteriota bacterium]
MRRRELLRLSAAAGLGLWLPRATRAAGSSAWPGRHLVLVQLDGGNDGLNTVVPFADPAYRRLRPRLGLSTDEVLRLDERLGLHSALEPLMTSWEKRDLAIALGVGYPEPNRSHFRSTDIVESGSGSETTLSEGWLTRLLADEPAPSSAIASGILLGGDRPGVLTGAPDPVALSRPQRLTRRAKRLEEPGDAPGGNPALAHLLGVQDRLRSAAGRVEALLGKAPAALSGFPRSRFATQLELAARLLGAGLDAPVLVARLGGFDTHANQAGTHRRLLGELAEGLAAFRASLIAQGTWDRVLVMTYSEFGRRAKENGSGGTDHGTAAPWLLMGGRVRGGLVGTQPSLIELDGGDLRHGLDFRRLHATAARGFFGLEAPSIDRRFRALDVLKV